MFRRYAELMRLIGNLSPSLTVTVALGLLGCAPSRPVATLTCAEADWRAQITPDSVLTFCAPPDLVQVKHSRIWTRAPAGSEPPFASEEWFTLYQLSAADAFRVTEIHPWPPSMLHDLEWQPCIHCFEVTGYAVHWDSVGSHLARVETGHVTGGFMGEQDKPMLEAAWMADSVRWVVVPAQSRTDSALRDLRRVLRTIQVRR
jgi:hypothetical protein